jgi:hypothetical protein
MKDGDEREEHHEENWKEEGTRQPLDPNLKATYRF